MLSMKKACTFLIKIAVKSEEDWVGKYFIAEEVQEVKKIIMIDIVDEEVNSKNSVKETRKNEDVDDTLSYKKIKVEKN